MLSAVKTNIEKQANSLLINTYPRFPLFLLYFRSKLGVTFSRRWLRDDFSVRSQIKDLKKSIYKSQKTRKNPFVKHYARTICLPIKIIEASSFMIFYGICPIGLLISSSILWKQTI